MISGQPSIVIHLRHSTVQPNAALTRVAAAGAVGGLLFVVAAIARVAAGGQSAWSFLLAMALAVLIFALLLGYAYMRQANATIFIHGGRVGFTNAIRLQKSLPIEDVDRFQRTVELDQAKQPVCVLLIVSKDNRRVLRFSGANRLEDGGVERIASEVGVSIVGSWRIAGSGQ